MNSQQDQSDKKIPCEVYSRIVGYLRPVQNWHTGKQQEYTERREFAMPKLEQDSAAAQAGE